MKTKLCWKGYFYPIFAFAMLTLMNAACQPSLATSEKELLFLNLYPEVPVDGYLRLEEITNSSPDDKVILIENVSKETVLIPPISSAHTLLTYDGADKEWVTLVEKTRYHGDLGITLYPEENWDAEQFSTDMFGIIPDLTGMQGPVEVRVVVRGVIVGGNSDGQEVVGFADLMFQAP